MNISSASCVLMVKPSGIDYNRLTSTSNVFQKENRNTPLNEIRKKALKEFENYVETLRKNDIDVFVFEDICQLPDAVFPNNWISFHSDGRIILHPMMAENRRAERSPEIVNYFRKNFFVKDVVDLSFHEKNKIFLEGTGSIVFDHINRLAYAALSPRTDRSLLNELCETIGYKPIPFIATDESGQEIYHTNMMMCIGEEFCVICLDAIKDMQERKKVIGYLNQTEKNIVAITKAQMCNFCGNMLELSNKKGKKIIVLSQRATEHFSTGQLQILQKHAKLLPVKIDTIETIGGGSARCMVAEVFLTPIGVNKQIKTNY